MRNETRRREEKEARRSKRIEISDVSTKSIPTLVCPTNFVSSSRERELTTRKFGTTERNENEKNEESVDVSIAVRQRKEKEGKESLL